jgi:hypothetical protein
MPKNLKDVFEISSDKKTWLPVKRPLLHVPSTSLQALHGVPKKTTKMYRFVRRRRVPTHGTQAVHTENTDRIRQHTFSSTFSKEISSTKNQVNFIIYGLAK